MRAAFCASRRSPVVDLGELSAKPMFSYTLMSRVQRIALEHRQPGRALARWLVGDVAAEHERATVDAFGAPQSAAAAWDSAAARGADEKR